MAASLTTPVAGAPQAFLLRNSAIDLSIPAERTWRRSRIRP